MNNIIVILFSLFVIVFTVLWWLMSIRHISLCYRCFYSMGLTKKSNLFSFMLSEGISIKASKWAFDIIFNRINIPEESKIWVDKIKLNIKICLILFILLALLLVTMFFVDKYHL